MCAPLDRPLSLRYRDGTLCLVPAGDDLYVATTTTSGAFPSVTTRALYELLTLEGAQAGLSWSTILRKREAYRHAFAGFDPEAVARFDRARIEELLQDRHRPQPPQGRVGRRERRACAGGAGRGRQLLRLALGLRGRRAARRRLDDARRATRRDASLEGDEQRAQAPRLSLRRAHGLLRLHAGSRARQRPRRLVLPLPWLTAAG